MPATNFVFDKRRSSRKRFRMGHRHDDDANGGQNELRHLENPYNDWDELINDRLLAKIETEHPLTDSIEEEAEDLPFEDASMCQYYDFNTQTNANEPISGNPLINSTQKQQDVNSDTNLNSNRATNDMTQNFNNTATIATPTPTLISNKTNDNVTSTTNQEQNLTSSTTTTTTAPKEKINFAITKDGNFDHLFEKRIKNQLSILLENHVKSEQIDCNDRSTYTGLPGISLLYHHLATNPQLDTKLRCQCAAKIANHINQYLTIISSQHMHNSKCSSFLCGELGVIALCCLARTQQRLHREVLTRTLSYPGPGASLSQSAPTTPGVLSSEMQSSNHHHHHHHIHNQMPFTGGPPTTPASMSSAYEQINLEPDTTKLLEKILELIKLQENQGTPDELLYGRTGGLYAMLLIKQQLPKQNVIKDEHITHHINLMLKSGQTMESFGRPLFYSWHGKEYIGAAHGYAGILYMLLEAHKYLNQDQLKLIREAINFVQSVRYPSGNYPSSMGGQTDRLVHWCHGAPGVIHMLIKAYQVYKEQLLLDLALNCGDVIWKRGLLKKGFSLCHGISGNAYAFLHLYQLTRDRKHLYRAGKFAQFYLEHGHSINWRADSPASLFEGYAGLTYFLADLLNPIEAKFPAFQLTSTCCVIEYDDTKQLIDNQVVVGSAIGQANEATENSEQHDGIQSESLTTTTTTTSEPASLSTTSDSTMNLQQNDNL